MNDTAPTPPPLDRSKPLLVIEEDIEDRFFVTIFGIDYFIKNRADLTLHDVATMEAIILGYGHIMTQLTAGKSLPKSETEKLDAPMDDLIRIFLPELPEEALQRMKPRERLAVVFAFNSALGPKPETPTPAAPSRAARRQSEKMAKSLIEQTKKSIGESSSRPSRGSTAPPTRSSGRTRRRSGT